MCIFSGYFHERSIIHCFDFSFTISVSVAQVFHKGRAKIIVDLPKSSPIQ